MAQQKTEQDIAYRQTKRQLQRLCARLDVQENSPTAIFIADVLKVAWENGHAQGVADEFWEKNGMTDAHTKND